MTDLALIIVTAITVKLTPKGRYKAIAWLLFGEFCIFGGFGYLTKSLPDGIWYDAITGVLSFIFAMWFLWVNARYLAVISGLIALYHIGIMWLGTDYYYATMLVFCLLQIGGLIPGVVYGYQLRHARDLPDNSGNHCGHHYSG